MENINYKYVSQEAIYASTADFEYLLNPLFIRRVVGAPSDVLSHLTNSKASEQVYKKIEIEKSLQILLPKLIGVLERNLKKLDKEEDRKLAINIKRDLFNRRLRKGLDLNFLAYVLSDEDLSIIADFKACIFNKFENDEQYEKIYQSDIDYGRNQLSTYFDNYNIKNGLIYSNPQLFKELQEAYNSDNKIKNKKKRNLENKLSLYLSRASVKTSPMTTFTTAQVDEWSNQGNDHLGMVEQEYNIDHKLKFGSATAQHIVSNVLNKFDNIYSNFKLKLNDALVIEAHKIKIIKTLSRSKMNPNMFGNIKGEVSVQLTPLLKAIVGIISSTETKAMYAKEICSHFTEKLGEAAYAPVMKALEDLFLHQVLILDVEWYEQEDNFTQIIPLLKKIGTPQTELLTEYFQEIQSLLNSYPTVGLDQRAILRQSFIDVVDLAAKLTDCELTSKEMDPPFYEDAFLESSGAASTNQSSINDFRDDLELWLSASPILSVNMSIQTAISVLFKEKYGEDGVCDNAKEFFEFVDSYLTSGEGEINGFLGPYKIPSRLANHPDLLKLQSIREKLVEGIVGRIEDGEIISLDKKWLKDLIDQVPPTIANRTISHSYYGQVFAGENKQQQFVINQTLVGYGILYSRFLDGNDTGKLEKLKQYLNTLAGDKTLVEIPGVYGFNANYHPQLLDHELSIESYKNNYKTTNKIAIEQCQLVYDKNNDRVYLKDEKVGQIEPIYLGFLTPIYLPELARLLSIGYNHGIVIFILAQLIQSGWIDLESEKFIPRVNLGNVVLWRKTWIYPKKNIPNYNLSEQEFFKELLIWKQEKGLNNEMFVRLGPVVSKTSEEDTEADENGNIDWANVDFTAMKPSYINFSNPITVQSFQKLLRRFSKLVIFQEALPSPGDSEYEIGGKKYVAELQLELSKIANRG